MKRYRVIPLFLVILVILILSIFVWLTTGEKKTTYTGRVGISVMKGIEVVHYKKDVLDWRAEIKEALFSQDKAGSRLKNVSIFYPKRDITLHSKKGFYNTDTGEIRLDGMVTGRGKGFSFKSPELVYLPSEDILTTSKGVVINGGKYTISGRNGKIKGSNVLEITGNVRALFY